MHAGQERPSECSVRSFRWNLDMLQGTSGKTPVHWPSKWDSMCKRYCPHPTTYCIHNPSTLGKKIHNPSTHHTV